MTSLPATSEASHHYLEWPCEAVIEALESTDLLSVWLGRRIETIVAEGNPLATWQHQQFEPKAKEFFLELGPQLDRVCLSVLQIDDAHLAQEWFFKLQEGDASFAELAPQSLGNSRDSGGHLGPLRVEDLPPPRSARPPSTTRRCPTTLAFTRRTLHCAAAEQSSAGTVR